MRNLSLLIVLGLFVVTSAQAGTRSMCFVSEAVKGVTRLRFEFPDSETELGEVRYEKGHGSIKIKRVKELEVARHGDRPSEIQTDFVELLAKGKGGTYQVVTQGAIVLSFKYVPQKKGKPTVFKQDADAEAEDECGWKVKPN